MKLYTKTNCPACENTKQFIRDANITDVQVCDATNDMVTRMRMSDAGAMTFPALEKDNGEFIVPSEAIIHFLAERENVKLK